MRSNYIDGLKMTDEQIKIFNGLKRKEDFLRGELIKAKIAPQLINKIIEKTDLEKIQTNNSDLMQAQIKDSWGDFIIERSKKNG